MADFVAPFAGDAAQGLAERLIDRFGTLSQIISAPLSQLLSVAGGQDIAVVALAGARRLVEAAAVEDLAGAIVEGSDPQLHRYLQTRIGGRGHEQLVAVFAGAAGGFVGIDTIADGSSGRIAARARPLFQRAMELGAAGFLLAHNHPSGLCRPSEVDVAETRRLADLASALDLSLIDHLIVTRTRVFSMRLGGCF